eukprot:6897111-Pyramimonas_sp.AAC.1
MHQRCCRKHSRSKSPSQTFLQAFLITARSASQKDQRSQACHFGQGTAFNGAAVHPSGASIRNAANHDHTIEQAIQQYSPFRWRTAPNA